MVVCEREEAREWVKKDLARKRGCEGRKEGDEI